MPTNYWGSRAKFFGHTGIELKNGVSFSELSNDPTLVATEAEANSLGVFGGRIYQKTDSGSTTNWKYIANVDDIEQLNKIDNRLDSTGVLDAPVLSAGATTGTFDVSAGMIQVVDNTTDINNPTKVEVDITAKTNVAITNILTQPVTYIVATSSDTILQLSGFPTPEQRRDNAFLGVVVHTDNVNVNAINNIPDFVLSPASQLYDLMRGIGAFNLDGNRIEANGANLSINKLSGSMFKAGVNAGTNGKNPHEIDLAAKILATFRYRLQDSVEGGDVTVLDPTQYDNGGVLTAVPTNNNTTIQRVYVFPSNEIRLQYGQEVFSNIADAVSAVGKETFVTEDNIKENGLLLASIVVRKGATDLTNPADGQIFIASRFGELGSVGSKFSTIFQDIYENSPIPQIVFDAIRGGLVFSDNATPITGDLLSVTDNAGTTKYHSVSRTHNQVTDNDGSFVVRKSIKYPYIEDFKVNAPSDVISTSGGGTVEESSDIPAIPIVSGFRSALLNSTASATFTFDSVDTTNMSTMGRKVALEFDCGYLSSGDDTYFANVEYSTDDVTFVQVPSTSTVRITGPNAYSIPFEYDKTTHPYVRLVIGSESIVLNSRISVDNIRLNSYLDSSKSDVVVTSLDVASPNVNTTYIFQSGSGDLILTLPEVHVSGDKITVKHLMDGITEWVEIVPNNTENIDGANSGYFMYDENQSLTLISDGTNWYII